MEKKESSKSTETARERAGSIAYLIPSGVSGGLYDRVYEAAVDEIESAEKAAYDRGAADTFEVVFSPTPFPDPITTKSGDEAGKTYKLGYQKGWCDCVALLRSRAIELRRK